jgi:hypothetical protein
MVGVAAVLALPACRGESRPNVEVIGGEETVSVSDLAPEETEGAAGRTPTGGAAASAGGGYAPAVNVDSYFAMGLDLRDIRAALGLPDGRPDWASAEAIYAKGKNQRLANGGVRALAELPNDTVQALFPGGPAVYGRARFVDGIVRDGLAGTGRAAGLSDDARKQVVEKGVLMLFYGKALQELGAAGARHEASQANAPVPVDETFAILAGPLEGSARPHSLLAVAGDRERDLGLAGKLAGPLEASLVDARAAADRRDRAAFAQAQAEARGYTNAIFYLSVLREARLLEGDASATVRQTRLASGWGYWQTIRAAAAGGSARAAGEVEAALSRDAAAAWQAADTARVYDNLNDPTVLSALGIPAALQVKAPRAR